MIDLRYQLTNHVVEAAGFPREAANPASSIVGRPASEGPSPYVSTLMTDDAWKVLGMIEQANEACAREYSGCGFGFGASAAGYTCDLATRSRQKDAEKPKIWSIADIIGEPADNSTSTAGDSRCRSQQSGGAPADYPYLDAIDGSWGNQQQLDPYSSTVKYGLQPTDERISQLLLQETFDGYCCRFIELLYWHGMCYQCVYCQQLFSSKIQLCQHQMVEHPVIM